MPAVQSVHTPLPAEPEAFPAGHAVHFVSPADAYCPGEQSAHEVDRALELNLPAAQLTQLKEPVAEYRPAWQSTQ